MAFIDHILVRGGKPLGGMVKVSGKVNSVLLILCALLLTNVGCSPGGFFASPNTPYFVPYIDSVEHADSATVGQPFVVTVSYSAMTNAELFSTIGYNWHGASSGQSTNEPVLYAYLVDQHHVMLDPPPATPAASQRTDTFTFSEVGEATITYIHAADPSKGGLRLEGSFEHGGPGIPADRGSFGELKIVIPVVEPQASSSIR